MGAGERELEERTTGELSEALLKHAEMMARKSLIGKKKARETILAGASRGVKAQETGNRALNLQNEKALGAFHGSVNTPTLRAARAKCSRRSISVMSFSQQKLIKNFFRLEKRAWNQKEG